jgi:hypothetical protein
MYGVRGSFAWHPFPLTILPWTVKTPASVSGIDQTIFVDPMLPVKTGHTARQWAACAF